MAEIKGNQRKLGEDSEGLFILIQESIETFGGFYGEVLKEPIQWQDGFIIPPTRPGLGIELNEDVAERHAYTGGVFPELVDTPITGLE